MHILSFLGFAAAFASVTVAQEDLPLQPDIKYDETADWYKDHGMPVPHVASGITVVEANRSYVVKLECPDCPFFVKEEKKFPWQKVAPYSWHERYNSLVRFALVFTYKQYKNDS